MSVVLKQKLATLVAEAKALLDAGDLEAAKTKRAEAETTKAALTEYEALAALTPAPDLIRPPLPIMEEKATPPAAGSTAFEAAYVTRFGQPDSLIKAILTDLHGADYMGLYYMQRRAFNRYLRGGEKAITGDDMRLLREVVLTPAAIVDALSKGVDDPKVLKATMVEASDTLGGYIVPVDFQARVIERVRGLTVVRPLASVETTSRDRLEYPVATGGDAQYTSAVRVTWVDETPTAGASETNLTWGLEAIPVHTVMAETPISRNMVEDAAFDVEGYLTRKFSEATAIDEDNKFLLGDGNGKPQGILPGGTNALGLDEVVSGSASLLTWDGLISLRYGIQSQYRQRARWIAERGTYEAIAKLENTTTGQKYWEPNGQVGEPARLQGFATLEQEIMPSIGTNTYPLIFGDVGGYTVVDRVGMTVERYLDSATARQNLIYYVMRRRLGGQVTESWRFVVQKCST